MIIRFLLCNMFVQGAQGVCLSSFSLLDVGWLVSWLAGQFICWMVWLDLLVGLVRFVG